MSRRSHKFDGNWAVNFKEKWYSSDWEEVKSKFSVHSFYSYTLKPGGIFTLLYPPGSFRDFGEKCRGKYCKRRGSAKVLELFERLAPDGVQIEVVDCLDECTLGPNVRLDGDDRRVQNGIKTAAQVAEILGVPVPDELDADA